MVLGEKGCNTVSAQCTEEGRTGATKLCGGYTLLGNAQSGMKCVD